MCIFRSLQPKTRMNFNTSMLDLSTIILFWRNVTKPFQSKQWCSAEAHSVAYVLPIIKYRKAQALSFILEARASICWMVSELLLKFFLPSCANFELVQWLCSIWLSEHTLTIFSEQANIAYSLDWKTKVYLPNVEYWVVSTIVLTKK